MGKKNGEEFLRYEKKFLDTVSDDGSDEFATCSWRVSMDSSYQGTRDEYMKVSMEASMRITDCLKHIVINLYAADSSRVQERINKLYVLREQVDKAIEAMYEARDHMIEVERTKNPKWDGKSKSED